MARTESNAIMGYLPIDPKHHAAITSRVTPVTLGHRLLDAFTGDGLFLVVARWGGTSRSMPMNWTANGYRCVSSALNRSRRYAAMSNDCWHPTAPLVRHR